MTMTGTLTRCSEVPTSDSLVPSVDGSVEQSELAQSILWHPETQATFHIVAAQGLAVKLAGPEEVARYLIGALDTAGEDIRAQINELKEDPTNYREIKVLEGVYQFLNACAWNIHDNGVENFIVSCQEACEAIRVAGQSEAALPEDDSPFLTPAIEAPQRTAVEEALDRIRQQSAIHNPIVRHAVGQMVRMTDPRDAIAYLYEMQSKTLPRERKALEARLPWSADPDGSLQNLLDLLAFAAPAIDRLFTHLVVTKDVKAALDAFAHEELARIEAQTGKEWEGLVPAFSSPYVEAADMYNRLLAVEQEPNLTQATEPGALSVMQAEIETPHTNESPYRVEVILHGPDTEPAPPVKGDPYVVQHGQNYRFTVGDSSPNGQVASGKQRVEPTAKQASRTHKEVA